MNDRFPEPPMGYADLMPPHEEARELVVVERLADGRVMELRPRAAEDWIAMKAAAACDGVTLELISAFRSVARQREIVAGKLARGQSLEEILKVSAYPGYSEHHTGEAVDIGCPGCPPLTEAYAGTGAWGWLMAHAARFGFSMTYPRGNVADLAFEPWHWRHRSVVSP